MHMQIHWVQTPSTALRYLISQALWEVGRWVLDAVSSSLL